MTNLLSASYTELQALAKENGIRANLSKDKLVKMLSIALDVEEIVEVASVQVETTVDEALAHAFDELEFEETEEKEITSHTDLEFTGYVSDGIAKYAFTLYTAHELDVRELNGKDYRFIKGEVDRLSALPFPPSPKQKNIINELIVELKEYNPQFDVPKEVISSLTGGSNGTAGEFIQFLYQQRNVFSENAPCTPAQADKIKDWFFCTDIPWAEHGINQKKDFPTSLNPNGWMWLSPEEFVVELQAKLTKKQASEFMGRYQKAYYEWKRGRINDNQIQTIRALENRLAGISKLGVKTFATNADGIVTEVYKKPNRDWNPQAYAPLEDMHIKQMEYGTASKYIKRLEEEVHQLTKSAIETSTTQQDLEDKRKKLGKASDKVNAITKEYQALVDLAYALEAVACHENEALHESITEVMVHNQGTKVEIANELYDFMQVLLDKKLIGFTNLAQMCEESFVATKVLEVKFAEQYEEFLNGKMSEEQKKAKREQKQEALTQQANTTVQDFMKQFTTK